MKITPLGTKIQIEIEKPKAGALDLDSIHVAKEIAKVVAMGDDVNLPIKIGDRIVYKSWAVDIVSNNQDKYYFIDRNSGGICGIIND